MFVVARFVTAMYVDSHLHLIVFGLTKPSSGRLACNTNGSKPS
jgi:predicted amidohydrolase YtcJ